MNDCILLIWLFLSLRFFITMNQYSERKRYCWFKTLLSPKAYTLTEIFMFAILLTSFLSAIQRDYNCITQTQNTIITNKYFKCFANYSTSTIFLTVPALFYLTVLVKEVKDLCSD